LPLTERFARAFNLARHLHAGQSRKGTDIPYIAHLMAVCALVLEMGGDENEAIAALLHDAVEDQGGEGTLKDIQGRFGDEVSGIVMGLTDTTQSPKPPWEERKKQYLDHLKTASAPIVRVSLADKLHNARTILLDLRVEGDRIWDRFKGKKDGSLWYYRSLVTIFKDIHNSPYVDELERVVLKIEALANEG
jgi:(p)ppGpp synthase/HD superfamily hydrolase